MTSRFQRNIKSNSYLVHYRPYQGTKKGKQVASSMKWGLVDNVVLRLMECLAPTVSFNLFMDNYFTFFRLFVCSPTLVLTTYEQEVCSRKIVYANILSSEINTCKKRNVATLNSAAHDQQKCCVTCVAGQNDSRALSIASSVSCQPNRNLFDVGANLKESIFKSNNQINSTVTTRAWVLSKECLRTQPRTGLVSE